MTGRLNLEALVGGALAVTGTTLCYFAWSIPPDSDGSTGARLFPMIGSITLAAMGLIEMVKGLRNSGTPIHLSDVPLKVVGAAALSVIYALTISKIGYLVATALAVPVILWLFGEKRPNILFLAAIACPVIFHLLFFELLGVFPPYGEHFDLLDLMYWN